MVDRPRLLDLFCGAGGATRGYQNAGFHVTGVDINPQRHYIGDEFHQGDALEYAAMHGHEFDAIHASPPCQRYSWMTKAQYKDRHPDLIRPTRTVLQATDRPYVIENVPNAVRHLVNPLMLCGSMFGLRVQRHRYFECSWGLLFSPLSCNHDMDTVYITGSTGHGGEIGRREFSAQTCRDASGIDWMTRAELDEAIPPAFTEWIGRQLMAFVLARQEEQ